MTKWLKIKIAVNQEAADALNEYLTQKGSAGVLVRGNREVFKEVAEMDDTLWGIAEDLYTNDQVQIEAYFDDTYEPEQLKQEIHLALDDWRQYGLVHGSVYMESHFEEEVDWALAYQAHYHPISINRYLTIVPEWLVADYEKRPDESLLVLDPGLAFGTGQHPTTSLCIQALTLVLRGGERVFDVGTGSGVLAIASALLGADSVLATDIDENSIIASQQNMALNSLQATMEVQQTSLLEGIDENADVIVANILAHIVMDFALEAYQHLHPGGHFIASGIIKEKRAEVEEELIARGFDICQIFEKDEWIAILAQKPREE